MSAVSKSRLQRRNGLEDAYLSMLPAAANRRGNAGLPTQDIHLNPLQQSRLRHVSMHVYRERSVIQLASVWQTLSYAIWWRVLIERRG
jgi:hypothetical protein